MALGDGLDPAKVAEYLAKRRAEARKDPEMKAIMDEEEARSARELERIHKEQQAEIEKTNPIVRATQEALYQTVKTTKMLCKDYGRLEQQVHESRTENEQLKQQLSRR